MPDPRWSPLPRESPRGREDRGQPDRVAPTKKATFLCKMGMRKLLQNSQILEKSTSLLAWIIPARYLNLRWQFNEPEVLCRPLLHDTGYEVFRLRDYIPAESPDPVVISKAQQLVAILLSLNGDFAGIVTYPPADYRKWVRIHGFNWFPIGFFITSHRVGHRFGQRLHGYG